MTFLLRRAVPYGWTASGHIISPHFVIDEAHSSNVSFLTASHSSLHSNCIPSLRIPQTQSYSRNKTEINRLSSPFVCSFSS
jgi:hypothetical protein